MHERAKDEIRHQIDVFFRAYVNEHGTATSPQHSEDWRGFSVDARSVLRGREAQLSHDEAMLRDTGADCPRLIDYEMIEIDYVFHGAICVVPYIARLRSVWTTGSITETKVRVLDVYVQEDKDWRQVASHMSLHPDTGPGHSGFRDHCHSAPGQR